MKKLHLILAATFVMPMLSRAAEKQGPSEEPPAMGGPRGFGPHHGFCEGLKLDEEQQKKMKDARFKFREEEIKLEAKVKEARLNYEKVLSDAKSDYKSAKSAADDVAKSLNEMMTAHELFKVKTAYEILNAEQRAVAAKCEEHMGPPHRGGDHKWPHKGPKEEEGKE